jgi:hypothetical protein
MFGYAYNSSTKTAGDVYDTIKCTEAAKTREEFDNMIRKAVLTENDERFRDSKSERGSVRTWFGQADFTDWDTQNGEDPTKDLALVRYYKGD